MEDNSLKLSIEEAIKASMKTGQKERTITLRMLLHEIKTTEKIKKTFLDDSETSLIIQKMTKQRKDSMSQFLYAGREELAQKEEREIGILSEFLPDQLSEEDIKLTVEEAIKDLKVDSLQDIGKVMGSLKKSLQGRADMSLVSSLVKTALSK